MRIAGAWLGWLTTSFLFCENKQEGCLVLVTKRFVTIDEFSSGWNPMRRNMQKKFGFFWCG
jgi:hypothetical protein